MGTKAVRVGNAQFTLHPIPFTKLNVGYCPRPQAEDLDLDALMKVGEEHGCTHIKIDVPNAKEELELRTQNAELRGTSPTFATATFLLDLTKSEEELLANMHSKTRYNVRLAERKGVTVSEVDNLTDFLKLQKETADRQGFFIHPDEYYHTQWDILRPQEMVHALVASYEDTPLAAYLLFKYNDTFYYPYGGSSLLHKKLMASNLLMWEAIKLGKKLGCTVFDMWGALPSPVDENDPWYGFHKFKQGFGPEHVHYPGAWDLVIKPNEYTLFKAADAARWKLLKLKR